MKNLLFTAAALLILAGSALQVAPVQNTQIAAKTKQPRATGGASTQSIPPPTCPANDPNGCGILD